MVMWKVVPLRNSLSNQMRPPCISTKLLVMFKPRPVPGASRAFWSSERKNFWKILDWSSALMPMPVSVTEKRINPALAFVDQPLPQDDPLQRQPVIDLARAELGWAPTVPLEQGLEPTIAYFRELLKR